MSPWGAAPSAKKKNIEWCERVWACCVWLWSTMIYAMRKKSLLPSVPERKKNVLGCVRARRMIPEGTLFKKNCVQRDSKNRSVLDILFNRHYSTPGWFCMKNRKDKKNDTKCQVSLCMGRRWREKARWELIAITGGLSGLFQDGQSRGRRIAMKGGLGLSSLSFSPSSPFVFALALPLLLFPSDAVLVGNV